MSEIVQARIDCKFKIVKKVEGSIFSLDPKNKISRISWFGEVTEETASKLLTLGADSGEFHGYNKLILDRRELTEFTTEARVWIKHDLLKTRAKKIVNKVDKVAFIGSRNTRGNIFSNFLSSAIGLVFPKLEMERFVDLREAIKWSIQ